MCLIWHNQSKFKAISTSRLWRIPKRTGKCLSTLSIINLPKPTRPTSPADKYKTEMYNHEIKTYAKQRDHKKEVLNYTFHFLWVKSNNLMISQIESISGFRKTKSTLTLLICWYQSKASITSTMQTIKRSVLYTWRSKFLSHVAVIKVLSNVPREITITDWRVRGHWRDHL